MISDLLIGRSLRGIGLWALAGIGLYFTLVLVSYTPQDPGWSYSGPSDAPIHNIGGFVGAWIADVSLHLFGYLAFLLPVLAAWSAFLIFHYRHSDLSDHIHILPLRWAGFVITLIAGVALADLYVHTMAMPLPAGPGGILGQFLAQFLVRTLDPLGSVLLLVSLFLIGCTLFSGLSWLGIMDRLGGGTLWVLSWSYRLVAGLQPDTLTARSSDDDMVRGRIEQRSSDHPSQEALKSQPVGEGMEPSVSVVAGSEDASAQQPAPFTKPKPSELDDELPPQTLLNPFGRSRKESVDQSPGKPAEDAQTASQSELPTLDDKDALDEPKEEERPADGPVEPSLSVQGEERLGERIPPTDGDSEMPSLFAEPLSLETNDEQFFPVANPQSQKLHGKRPDNPSG